MTQHAFPRNFKTKYLEADHGEGIYIYDKSGKKYLDGCQWCFNFQPRTLQVPEIIEAVKEKQYGKLGIRAPLPLAQ